jgi:guanine deaminase
MKWRKTMNNYMQKAIQEAARGVELGNGGPFGAVVVDCETGEIVASAHNQVLISNDPTMHAEVAAIRAACAKLGRFSLHDCEIYSTCMPCPMCLSAIIWAKIPKLIYGASAKNAAAVGFDDECIYNFIRENFNDREKLSLEIIDVDECKKLFSDWENKKDKTMY